MNISRYHQRQDKIWKEKAEREQEKKVLVFTNEQVEILKKLLPIEIKRAKDSLAPAKYVLNLKEIKEILED